MTKNLVLTGALLAFDAATSAAQDRSAFEVASVKPSSIAAQGSSVRLTPGGRLVAQNATLELLITTAYKIRDAQLIGGTSWIRSDHFDIEARASGMPGADQVSEMLRSLLAERFQLVVHQDTRQLPLYRLVTTKSGPKLTAAREGECTPMVPPPVRPDPATLRPCGGFNMARNFLIGGGASLDQLAVSLSRVMGETVVNETAVEGAYDMTLRWTPDATQTFLAPAGAPQPVSDDGGPSIFSALQEQLGLRLEAGHGPVEVLVVDRAAYPAAN